MQLSGFEKLEKALDEARLFLGMAEEEGVDDSEAAHETETALEAARTEIERQELRARRRVFMLTGRAGTAGIEGEHHVIARLDALDLGSHGFDDPGSLMAKNHGHRNWKAVTAGDVGMTDADASHPDQHLIFARGRHRNRLEGEGTADFAQYGCLCRRAS